MLQYLQPWHAWSNQVLDSIDSYFPCGHHFNKLMPYQQTSHMKIVRNHQALVGKRCFGKLPSNIQCFNYGHDVRKILLKPPRSPFISVYFQQRASFIPSQLQMYNIQLRHSSSEMHLYSCFMKLVQWPCSQNFPIIILRFLSKQLGNKNKLDGTKLLSLGTTSAGHGDGQHWRTCTPMWATS